MKKIKSIQISDSPFFEDFKLEFSDKLNCIMGGRGTGKTTLLNFIKTSLNKDESSAFNILKSNLGGGKITLEFEVNNENSYKIIKTFNEEPQPYKSGDGSFISIERILQEIECDIYEAQMIEQIGRNGQNRLDLIDKKISNEVYELQNEIMGIQIDLDSNSQEMKSINAKLLQMQEKLKQYENVNEELKEHKENQPIGINEQEKKDFEVADTNEKIRTAERRALDKSLLELNSNDSEIQNKIEEINDYVRNNLPVDASKFINKDLMTPILKEVKDALNLLVTNYTISKERLKKAITVLEENSDKLKDKHEIQQAEFVKLKQKFEKHKEYINKYNRLSKQVDDRNAISKDKIELSDKRKKIKQKRDQLIGKLNKIKQTLFNKRLKCIHELNSKFQGVIVINLIERGLTLEYEESLRNALKGSGLKYNELIPKIIQSFSPDSLAEIVFQKNIEELKTITGIDNIRSETIINALYETDAIYKIESLYCPDLPEFLLKIKTNEESKADNYKKSDELSMGQRCTTVLPIIFAVSNNPLLIDQPEDNLDNKYITESIHEIIRTQKEERQLIFITHNPNIPVLSDSEKNFFLSFDNKAKIESQGNINSVKDNIISLLEGGKEAFLKRKEIYGI